MPIQLPENVSPLSTEDIRAFMRDQPDYNILLDDIEFEDSDILRAMRLTVSKWNAIAPITNLTSYEQLNEWILLCGVCCILLRSEGIRQKRNQLMTQDGNISPVGIDEKESLYMKWSMIFCDEFERLSRDVKKQKNMESILDSGCNNLGSGYAYLGRFTR